MCVWAPVLRVCVHTTSVGQKNVNYLVTTLLVWLTVHFEAQPMVKK